MSAADTTVFPTPVSVPVTNNPRTPLVVEQASACNLGFSPGPEVCPFRPVGWGKMVAQALACDAGLEPRSGSEAKALLFGSGAEAPRGLKPALHVVFIDSVSANRSRSLAESCAFTEIL